MKIRPLGERVLIKQTKQEETTKSGIVLPDTASKEKPIIGEVTAIGEAIKEIKSYDKDAKIIIVSADIQEFSKQKARENGAMGFINKPINKDTISMMLNKLGLI